VLAWGAQLNAGSSALTYIPTTTAAVYSLPIDHNPTTFDPLGVLIEEQRTNLLTYSEDITNGVWLKSNITVTANAVAAPDGTTTADLCTPTASGYILRTYATASTAYAVSAFVKASGTVSLFECGGYAGPDGVIVRFNILAATVGSPTVTGTGVHVASSITDVGGGWYRCVVVFSGVVNANLPFSPIYNAAQSGGLYLWGAQLE
jgi:hypothetical protein